MLGQGVQCRCQGVPLFARFALMDGTPLPVFVPPEVCGLLSIPEARERDECRGDGVHCAETQCARSCRRRCGRQVTRLSPQSRGRQRREACLTVRPCQPLRSVAQIGTAESPRRKCRQTYGQGRATRGDGRCQHVMLTPPIAAASTLSCTGPLRLARRCVAT